MIKNETHRSELTQPKATEKGAESELQADLTTPALHLFVAAQLSLQCSQGIGGMRGVHGLGHTLSGQTIFIDLRIGEKTVCKIHSAVT